MTRYRLLLGIQPLERLVGACSDGTGQGADRLVGVVPQGSPPAAFPQFGQHELEKRQVARTVAHILDDAIDQAGLECQSHCLSRLDDRAMQLLRGHRAEVDLAISQAIRECPVGESLTEKIAAHGQDDVDRTVRGYP